MFLNLKITLLLALTFTSLTAPAQASFLVGAGDYNLVTGNEALCPDFSVSEGAARAGQIILGGLYAFELRNSVHSIESDIDPTCEFKEQNLRENYGDKTVLTRINEEYCKGKLRSKTISTATITTEQISVRHEVDNAEPLNCLWKKQ